MEYAYLGRTGMKVSRLCLGTMNFGPNTDEKEAFAIMDRALESGINFFDTANIYGGRNGGHPGWTEEIIGRWFAQGGGRRERVILTTKVYADMQDPFDGPNGDDGLSAYKIRRHLEGSLKRLQTDHVEIYQMHHFDPHATWDELWGVFENLVNQGKIYYTGSSNFAAHQLITAQAEASKRNFLGLVCEEHRYNLLCRLPELEVLPAARNKGIGVVAFSPLAMGLLGGNVLNPERQSARSNKFLGNMSDAQIDQISRYGKLCREIGETEANVAVAWILSNPVITSPIVGPRTIEQLDSNLRALEIKLSEDVLNALDEIFPGPGGEATQAYNH
jgi:aryl-alcohol dehydrogenase-like predicted oxidoreductase